MCSKRQAELLPENIRRPGGSGIAGRREGCPGGKGGGDTAQGTRSERNREGQGESHFAPLFKEFGRNVTTKVEIVSGPKEVKMLNGGVAGKQWIATSGKYRFKLTIQDSMGVKLDQLVERLQKLPGPYMKACTVVSDEGEDGIAIYASNDELEKR